jgi:hypothetical protein
MSGDIKPSEAARTVLLEKGGGEQKAAIPVEGAVGEEKRKRRGSFGRGMPTEELPPDAVRTKRCTYDQVRAIAMAPRDGIGGFGWAALGGLAASLPATVQDIWASYISEHPVALPPGRLVDIIVTAAFLVAFLISRFGPREANSKKLLAKLFPDKAIEQ